jgi:hypothetical protein
MVRREPPIYHCPTSAILRASVPLWQLRGTETVQRYSTVTDFARLRGWSTFAPRLTAM